MVFDYANAFQKPKEKPIAQSWIAQLAGLEIYSISALKKFSQFTESWTHLMQSISSPLLAANLMSFKRQMEQGNSVDRLQQPFLISNSMDIKYNTGKDHRFYFALPISVAFYT
jgi:hypothetical protein